VVAVQPKPHLPWEKGQLIQLLLVQVALLHQVDYQLQDQHLHLVQFLLLAAVVAMVKTVRLAQLTVEMAVAVAAVDMLEMAVLEQQTKVTLEAMQAHLRQITQQAEVVVQAQQVFQALLQ
jgi:hypothetical protein